MSINDPSTNEVIRYAHQSKTKTLTIRRKRNNQNDPGICRIQDSEPASYNPKATNFHSY